MAITVSIPAGSRATRLKLSSVPANTLQTKWRLKSTFETSFVITTAFGGSSSANVLDGDINFLDIWLPPFHTYTVETRHVSAVDGVFTDWTAATTFTSRGPLNSFEKYQALSGISGVDNIEAT